VFGFGSCITHGKNMLLQSDQIKKKQDEFAVDVATHEVKKVSTRYGNMFCFTQDSIGKALIGYGEYCHPEIELLKKYLTKQSFVIDIGANIGTHSIGIGPYVAKVMAIEPDKQNHGLLTKNLSLAMLKNVSSNRLALSDTVGHVGTKFDYGKTKLDPSGKDVMCTKLDLIKGFPRLDLIKIDVEGMELNVLNGASATISYYQPKIFVEVHDVSLRPYIYDFLKGHNFFIYWVMTPTDPVGTEEPIFGPDHGVVNWFCSMTELDDDLEPVVDRDDNEDRVAHRKQNIEK
jgi:FkbM family methyltransferase